MGSDIVGVKYKINSNYLDRLDTPDKAYFLGFAMADGNIYMPKGKNTWRFTLEILSSDDYVLENFNRRFSYNKPLVYRQRQYKPTSSLIIYNQNICSKLISYGVVPQKTFKEEFPSLSPNLRSHFIRGIFDGDGCISSNSMIIKNSIDMCNNIKDILDAENIKAKCYIDNNSSKPMGILAIYNKCNLIKMRDYLYRDAHCFLSRKKDIFNCISMKNKGSKLSEKEVIQIVNELKINNCNNIALKYNVSRKCISNIKTGRTWGWLMESI